MKRLILLLIILSGCSKDGIVPVPKLSVNLLVNDGVDIASAVDSFSVAQGYFFPDVLIEIAKVERVAIKNSGHQCSYRHLVDHDPGADISLVVVSDGHGCASLRGLCTDPRAVSNTRPWVMAHEIGHLIGLGHTSSCTIMGTCHRSDRQYRFSEASILEMIELLVTPCNNSE